ncbi:MAG TPA: hypothetical protein VF009_10255 [Solirubrobacterales bacterium]
MPSGRAGFLALFIAAFAGTLPLQACGGTKTLSEGETKQLLRQLPYRFEFQSVAVPSGASGAVAGVAYGPHHTVLRFGVSLGSEGEPVSLGPHSDLADATGGETFRVTGDDTLIVGGKLQFNPRIKTRAQWNTVTTMHVDIEEKLCRATEGHACPI